MGDAERPVTLATYTKTPSTRRAFMRALAGGGIASAALIAENVLDPHDASETHLEATLPGINAEISETDWEGIFAKVEYYRKINFTTWKSMITIVDSDMAGRVPQGKSDWEFAKKELEEAKAKQSWGEVAVRAGEAKISFPNKAEELHSMIDRNFDDMIERFHDIDSEYVKFMPINGFWLKNILYPGREIKASDEQWEQYGAATESAHTGNTNDLRYQFAYLKHFASERVLRFYPDPQLRLDLRRSPIDELNWARYYERPWEFLTTATEARLCEADIVQMTPNGLLVR